MVAENSRNRSKLTILPVTVFRGRALSSICDNQQSAHGPLIIRQKRNTKTRDCGRNTWGCRIMDARPRVCGSGHTTPCIFSARSHVYNPEIPRVFNPRSRVSALLIVARGRGNTRVWLIVAGSEGARPREAGTERWPCFCGLRRFAANMKFNQRQ